MKKLSTILLSLILIAFSVSISGRQRTSDEVINELGLVPEVLRIIETNYVDKNMIDEKELIYGSIEGMLKKLEDPHTRFIPPDNYKEMKVETSGEFGGLGIVIAIEDGVLTVISPIDDTPAYKEGVQAGDKIVKINGDSTDGIEINQAVNKLRGKAGTKVTITIFRASIQKEFDITITRDKIEIKSVKATMASRDIGYIRITNFNAHTKNEVRDAYKKLAKSGAKKLIIDVRNNPGGLLKSVVEISDLFLEKGIIVSTKGRAKNQDAEYDAYFGDPIEKVPVVLLINGRSASASEILAGALQDNKRAKIIGVQSYGKGSVQTVRPLSDGSALAITTAKYYTPSGRSINRNYLRIKKDKEYAKAKPWGIMPDVVVDNPGDTDLKPEEILNLYRMNETNILEDFAKSHNNYNDEDVRDIMKQLKEKKVEVNEKIVRFNLISQLSRRHEGKVFLDMKADKQLSEAMELLND